MKKKKKSEMFITRSIILLANIIIHDESPVKKIIFEINEISN